MKKCDPWTLSTLWQIHPRGDVSDKEGYCVREFEVAEKQAALDLDTPRTRKACLGKLITFSFSTTRAILPAHYFWRKTNRRLKSIGLSFWLNPNSFSVTGDVSVFWTRRRAADRKNRCLFVAARRDEAWHFLKSGKFRTLPRQPSWWYFVETGKNGWLLLTFKAIQMFFVHSKVANESSSK